MLIRILCLAVCLFFGFGCATSSESQNNSMEGVVIQPSEKGLSVAINGAPFTEYICRGLSRPALYPLYGPGQVLMTRHWPFEDVPGEEHDHPHHLSVFFAHEINGQDFWTESPKAGKTVHQKFLQVRSGKNEGLIQSSNHLVSVEGKLVATDTRTIRIYPTKAGRLFDYEVTIYAAQGPLTFADTKEGTMAVRVAESMRVIRNKKPAEGHIVLSTGIRDGEAWGKRAEWCDYYGPVQGRIVGIAMFDHPQNPRHPTWWHVRDYGLFAANPFGIHDFEKKPAGAGELTVPAGQNITFKYRIYLHEGDEKQAEVARLYNDYVSGKRVTADGR